MKPYNKRNNTPAYKLVIAKSFLEMRYNAFILISALLSNSTKFKRPCCYLQPIWVLN